MAETLAKQQKSVFDGTLRWVSAHLGRFTLPEGEEQRSKDAGIDARHKAFGELSVALLLLSRSPETRRLPEVVTIADHLEGKVREPLFFFDMMRRPNLFPFYLTILIALEACDRPVPGLRSRLQRILDFGLMDAVERSCWSQIDLGYYFDLAGLRHRMNDPLTLFRLSSAARFADLAYARDIDVYALTHILFHLADFGRRDLEPFLGARREETREVVALLLGLMIHRSDCDLTGELLICCRCLREEPAPFHSLGWSLLAERQLPEGDLPDRSYDPGALPVDPDEAARKRFEANYHPTLVGLLASTVELFGRPGS